MKELRAIVAARQAAPHQPFALATVVEVTGSSYRRPGARMLVGGSGRVAGTVSGGCLEEDVIQRAQLAMDADRNDLAVYDTTDEQDAIFGTGLGCGGRIVILIEPLLPGASWPLAEAVGRVLAGRESETFVTVIDPRGGDVATRLSPPKTLPLGRQQRAGPGEHADLFVERLLPPPGLIVFGAGPDAGPLVRIGRELGYYITMVDRRPAVIPPPEVDDYICGRPGGLRDRIRLGANDAAIIMNHHYETDRDALEFALAFPLAYLGILGPRRRTDRILDELAKRGGSLPPDRVATLHAPAGLDLGSENPEQIALSIVAEIQGAFSGRSGGKLRSRSAPINTHSMP